MSFAEPKHAKEEKLVANVPADDYYKAQINMLEKKLDELQTQHEIALDYISDLEKEKIHLTEKVEHLRNAVMGVIEEKYGHV